MPAPVAPLSCCCLGADASGRGQPVVAQRLLEGLDDRGVELRPGVRTQLGQRVAGAAPTTVGAIRDHGIERIAYRDDSSAQRNLLARQAVGVAAAVPTLVREADKWCQLPQA